MIIKSISRKSKSFSQLYDYLMRDDNFSFTRNTYSNSKNKKELIKEFMENSDYLKTSRGKNYLYHELLSLEVNNLSLEKQKEILLDLAQKYLKLRAENHLSLGVIHTDKNHIHLHLMISANEIEKDKRVRLSKRDFKSIQATLEHYKNEKYRELSKTSLYQDKKDLSKQKLSEQEIKHKRKTSTKKEEIKSNLRELFNSTTSKTQFFNQLKSLNYELYTRGNTKGIIFENKKYRLKTLGLDTLFTQTLEKLEALEKQREKENIKEQKAR